MNKRMVLYLSPKWLNVVRKTTFYEFITLGLF